jgi:transcriptional regulator with XRE-family HTH domain
MTTQAEDGRPGGQPVIRRPASGVMIDPHQLIWWRERNGWSRQDLADRVARLYLDGHPDALPFAHRDKPADGHEPVPALQMHGLVRLCTVCGAPVSGGLTRDAIAKNESSGPNRRRPKPANLRAIIAALSEYGEPVRPAELLRGAPRQERSAEALERDARLDRNQKMREFAVAIGRPELAWNASGRARYLPELERLYDKFLKDRARTERRLLARLQPRAAEPAMAATGTEG